VHQGKYGCPLSILPIPVPPHPSTLHDSHGGDGTPRVIYCEHEHARPPPLGFPRRRQHPLPAGAVKGGPRGPSLRDRCATLDSPTRSQDLPGPRKAGTTQHASTHDGHRLRDEGEAGKRRAVRTNFLIDQPVVSSTQRVMARAVNTMFRWASIDSRLWW
jgi:hypothetical protein